MTIVTCELMNAQVTYSNAIMAVVWEALVRRVTTTVSAALAPNSSAILRSDSAGSGTESPVTIQVNVTQPLNV